jgi:hypothetical protein
MYGSGVEALFRRRETRKVLYSRGNFLALDTLDVVVAEFSREIAIFSVRLFDPTVAELACQIDDWSKDLVDAEGLGSANPSVYVSLDNIQT